MTNTLSTSSVRRGSIHQRSRRSVVPHRDWMSEALLTFRREARKYYQTWRAGVPPALAERLARRDDRVERPTCLERGGFAAALFPGRMADRLDEKPQDKSDAERQRRHEKDRWAAASVLRWSSSGR